MVALRVAIRGSRNQAAKYIPRAKMDTDVRVAVLGMGYHGRTVARELASDNRVSDLILADKRVDHAKYLLPVLRTASASVRELDVADGMALSRTLSEVDVAVNMVPEAYNMAVMDACLKAGCGYVDVSSFHPTAENEHGDIRDQLGQDGAWQARGLTAIVSIGSDPGLPNILARAAADRLRSVDAILIRRAASAGEALDGYPLYSAEAFLRYALAQPIVWEDGRFVPRRSGADEEDFEFPPPIGRRRVHLFRSESVLTLPLRLGKPVGRVDYKHDIRPDLIQAIHSLDAIDMLDPHRSIRVHGQRLTFRDAFLRVFPDPLSVMGLREGAWVIVVEVRGRNPEGERATIQGWVLMENREASDRRQTTPEHLLTSTAAAAGAILIGTKKAPRAGVLVPEEIPPEVIAPELELRGVRQNFVRANT